MSYIIIKLKNTKQISALKEILKSMEIEFDV
jgi:hypothetical protein